MCCLLRIFLLARLVLVAAQSEVINWRTSWSSANSLCELTGSGLSGEVKVEKVSANSTQRGRSYWIGAISHHTPWFDVFTCRVVTEDRMILKSDVKVVGNDQPLYDCSNACTEYRVFALSDNACYCNYSLQGIGDPCENIKLPSTLDVCGHSAKSVAGKIAILQYDTNTVQRSLLTNAPYNGTGTGDCAAAILLPGNSVSAHEFLPCETKLPFICNRRLIQDPVDWAEAVVRCNLVLTASWGGRYDTPADSPTRAWSATSRRSKLYWAQDSFMTERTAFNCVALSVGQNGEMSLSKRTCEDKLPFLCEKGTMKTTTTPGAETTSSSSPYTTDRNSHSTTTATATESSTKQQTTTDQPEPPVSTITLQVTTLDTYNETTNSTVEDLPYQSDSSYLLMLAAMLAGVVLLVVMVVLCLIYKRERRRHLFSTDKKKENADMVYSVVKRHKCHTKELRDILDTLSDTSYDVDISAQMTEKHPSDFYLNGSFDPSEGQTPPDDLSHWYRSSLLIQVVPEGQTHTLMVSDLHPTPDTESVDDLYSQILRGKHNEDTAPEGY